MADPRPLTELSAFPFTNHAGPRGFCLSGWLSRRKAGKRCRNYRRRSGVGRIANPSYSTAPRDHPSLDYLLLEWRRRASALGNGGGNVLNGNGELALIFSDGFDSLAGFDPNSQTVAINP